MKENEEKRESSLKKMMNSSSSEMYVKVMFMIGQNTEVNETGELIFLIIIESG